MAGQGRSRFAVVPGLYQEWIGNGRRLTAIVTEMEKISAQAAEIILRQAATD